MRVGLNLLYLVPGKVGGVETFGRELIDALAALADPDTDFVVFTSLDGVDLLDRSQQRLRVVVLPFHARRRTVRYFWEQCILPWIAWREKIDVLHSLSYVGPLLCPPATIVTIHDANTSTVGATMPWYRRFGLSAVSRLASHTSNLVTTVSEFSRLELVRWYGLQPESVRVVLSGPGRLSQPSEDATPLAGVAFTEPYIAVIGGTYPHKNIPRLLDAFAAIQDRCRHKLVILGNLAPEAQVAIERLRSDRIVVTGYVSDAQLRDTIRHSDLFVMPSLYEGFGFPVLEAQRLEVPVACSRRGSLPEVVGTSAVLFDPENVAEIADCILRCVHDRALNQNLREAAAANVARFSWRTAARQYLECYAQVLPRKSGKRSVQGTYAGSPE